MTLEDIQIIKSAIHALEIYDRNTKGVMIPDTRYRGWVAIEDLKALLIRFDTTTNRRN